MAHHNLHRYVEQLVSRRPDKAIDILVGCCDDGNVMTQVLACLAESSNGQNEPRSPSNRPSGLNITLAPAQPISPLDSPHSSSPFRPERLSRRPTTFTNPPLSPPRTVSSVTSNSSNDGSTLREYIYLLNCAGNGVEEILVRMRVAAPIQHSVIREDIIHRRNLTGNLEWINPPQNVLVTHSGTPHIPREVTVRCSVELTWRRPNSESTHSTKFYIVPGAMLDTDVLLGYEDSGEGVSGTFIHLCGAHA